MKTFTLYRASYFFFLATLVLASVLNSSRVYAQPTVETARENVIVSPQIHGFWEYLPSDYNSNPAKRYPLIVFIHGAGEVGDGNLPGLRMVLIHGLPRVIEAGIFPQSVTSNGQSYSFIVLSPQYLPSGCSIVDIDEFLNYAFAHYRVDRNRVYLTGFSHGGTLIYQYAGASFALAQKVTAVVPLSPCVPPTTPQAATIAANNVAVWGIHGESDVLGICQVSFTPGWINAINTANSNIPPTPPAVYSLIPTPPLADPHDIFWTTFETGFSVPPTNKNIYDWMIQYARNTALPITLKNFSVEYRDKKVLVNWTTSNESNSKEFRVQRAGKDLQFQTIGTISASGISNNDKSYAWVDEFPLNGVNYYRLQLVNVDNSSEYFDIKNVLVISESKLNLLSSNPATEFIKLGIDLDRKQNVAISLLDIQGRVMYERSGSYQQGRQELFIRPTRLPAGTYLIKVVGEYFTESKKIILQ